MLKLTPIIVRNTPTATAHNRNFGIQASSAIASRSVFSLADSFLSSWLRVVLAPRRLRQLGMDEEAMQKHAKVEARRRRFDPGFKYGGHGGKTLLRARPAGDLADMSSIAVY